MAFAGTPPSTVGSRQFSPSKSYDPYKEPLAYPDIISVDDIKQWYAPVSIALGLKTRSGITILGDGLSLVTERRDGGKIIDLDTQMVKVHRLTPHAVIGFSGHNLETTQFKKYAKEIQRKLAERYPLSLQDITNEVANYLKDKLASDVIMGALIAGYEYDKSGKACSPGFMRLEYENSKFQDFIDQECYSATAEFKNWLDYQVSHNTNTGLEQPAQSISDAVKILDDIIHAIVENLKTGIFIGGEIRAWHISPGGINEQLVDDIPPTLNVGQELPQLPGERHSRPTV